MYADILYVILNSLCTVQLYDYCELLFFQSKVERLYTEAS